MPARAVEWNPVSKTTNNNGPEYKFFQGVATDGRWVPE